jgi:hypothetical protein
MFFVDAVLPSYLQWLEKNDPEHWRQLINIGMNSGEIVKAQWLGLEPTMAELRGQPCALRFGSNCFAHCSNK